MVKSLPAKIGDTGEAGSIQESGRSPGGRHGILAWEIPMSEEPGWLQSMGPQRVGHDRAYRYFKKYPSSDMSGRRPSLLQPTSWSLR